MLFLLFVLVHLIIARFAVEDRTNRIRYFIFTYLLRKVDLSVATDIGSDFLLCRFVVRFLDKLLFMKQNRGTNAQAITASTFRFRLFLVI